MHRAARTLAVVITSVAAAAAVVASAEDRAPAARALVRTTPLPDPMSTMIRADRDKDGVLSRDELEHYDMSLARRFREGDADRDGRLTLNEFEKLLLPPQTSANPH